MTKTLRGQFLQRKKAPVRPRVPGKDSNNPQLPAQLRKQLKKHYVNKYRAVKQGS